MNEDEYLLRLLTVGVAAGGAHLDFAHIETRGNRTLATEISRAIE